MTNASRGVFAARAVQVNFQPNVFDLTLCPWAHLSFRGSDFSPKLGAAHVWRKGTLGVVDLRADRKIMKCLDKIHETNC